MAVGGVAGFGGAALAGYFICRRISLKRLRELKRLVKEACPGEWVGNIVIFNCCKKTLKAIETLENLADPGPFNPRDALVIKDGSRFHEAFKALRDINECVGNLGTDTAAKEFEEMIKPLIAEWEAAARKKETTLKRLFEEVKNSQTDEEAREKVNAMFAIAQELLGKDLPEHLKKLERGHCTGGNCTGMAENLASRCGKRL